MNSEYIKSMTIKTIIDIWVYKTKRCIYIYKIYISIYKIPILI